MRIRYLAPGGGDHDRDRLPILILHGGRGSSHDYLELLGGLAATGRRVVFYDQIGHGRSSKLSDSAMSAINLLVEEIRAVRAKLVPGRMHLLGHSWGHARTIRVGIPES